MADFKEVQQKLSAAKKQYETAQHSIYSAKQRGYLLDAKISKVLQERLLAELPAGDPLLAERAALQQQVEAAKSAQQTAADNLKLQSKEFNALGDVRSLTTNLNDNFPVLLMPLRVQTRFQTIKHIARNIPDELLIDVSKAQPSVGAQLRRIFPDLKPEPGPKILSSQTFMLSNRTDAAARQMITQLSATGFPMPAVRRWQKVEDVRELVVRIYPDDLYIQNHEPALTETEYAAGKFFWQNMWDAEREFQNNTGAEEAVKTKKEKQVAAWKALRTDCLAHRASWVVTIMRPAGYPESFTTDLITIPDNKFPSVDLKSESWTMPPFTPLLPEKMLVRLEFNGVDIAAREAIGAAIPVYLQLGFDPDENEEPLDKEKDGVLELPKAIRWLTDLDEAEKCGMAVRFQLSPVEISVGVARVIVAGVKAGADHNEGEKLFSDLVQSHRFRPDGFAFLPQGTSTNNIPGQPSGFSQAGLTEEESFNLEFTQKKVDPESDGQRFATALGLSPDTVTHLTKNDHYDVKNAVLLNKVLWPGTMGYYLDNMMRPAINDADVSFIKSFFESHVTGRGLLPAFRAGKQPYGIVPATAWSLWKPDAEASAAEIKMVNFLQKLDRQWTNLVGTVKTMKSVFSGNKTEAQRSKEFRELLTLQSKSTRFFRRLVAGEYLLWSVNSRNGELGAEKVGIKTTPAEYKAKMEAGWGEAVTVLPKMLGKFLDDTNYKLTDLVPGESGENPVLTPGGKNYLTKLVSATFKDLQENKFGDDFASFVTQRSSRLFFHLAKFALLQSSVAAAVAAIRKTQPDLSPFAGLDFEFEYVNANSSPSEEHSNLLKRAGFTEAFKTIKNKWELFNNVPVEGRTTDTRLGGRTLDSRSTSRPRGEASADLAAKSLTDMRSALTDLSDLPVEKLDRLFSEHIDLCSFRLDAWMQGLVTARISKNRRRAGFERGLYIGAYGYLENLTPSADEWIATREIDRPVEAPFSPSGINAVIPVYDFTGLSAEQIAAVKKEKFVYLGSAPGFLVRDAGTGKIINQASTLTAVDTGFVLTPSLEHASTAGILRAGYEHHSMSQGGGAKTLAVSLDSQRTGRAIEMLKSINAGHSLNEQIGYFVERGMYEDARLAAFVIRLRETFPLKIERNEWDDDQHINSADKTTNLALSTDGLALLFNFENTISVPSFETKLGTILNRNAEPSEYEARKTALLAIIEEARDQFDAVGDLVLAESVYQTVKGNPERAAAALRITSDGGNLQLPQVAHVPVDSNVLTHRTGFVLNARGSLDNVWSGSSKISMFAKISPELNRWLADQLPAPDKIMYLISKGDEPFQKIKITQLGLQPIDFYYLIRTSGNKVAETVIPWLAKNILRTDNEENLRAEIKVSFERNKSFEDDEYAVEDILPQIYSLGILLENARPMKPSDFMINPPSDVDTRYDNTRLRVLFSQLSDSSEAGVLNSYISELTQAEKDLRDHFPKEFDTNGAEPYFYALIRVMCRGYLYGYWDCAPRAADVCDLVNARIVADQCLDIIELLQQKLGSMVSTETALNTSGATLTPDKIFEQLNSGITRYFGEQFMVLPLFDVFNKAEVDACIADKGLMNNLNEFAVEEWMQGLSMVREQVRSMQTIGNLRNILQATAGERSAQIIQLPYLPGQKNRWIGQEFPDDFEPSPMATSMVFEFSDGTDLSAPIAGLLVDEWKEKLPVKQVSAAVSIKYNQANSEAAQCMLLLASPEQKGNWDFDYVLKAVSETMLMAKKRAIDTETIQTTWMSQFLPAIVTPFDTDNNTPGMDFRVGGPPIIDRPIPDRPGGGGVFEPMR